MANGLKFSDRELADLRQVAYGGYKKTPDRTQRLRSSQTKKIPGGAIDYNFYSGRQRKNIYRGFETDMAHFYEDAKKGSTSANFAKIAKELGIKKVDSTNDLRQMYDYVLGYKREDQQQQQAPAPVEQPQTGFTPTELPTDFDSPQQPQQPQQPQGPDFAALFAEQIASMQQMFQQSMQQQQQQYMQMQQAQDERMAALQQQMQQSMQQSMIAQQTRPEVAGVKMAEGTAGTPMQIARRGVTGAFGRRGMRISSINV
jgi:hypothetical protein